MSTKEEIPVHPLFVEAVDDKGTGLTREIETIDIRKVTGKGRSKRTGFVCWVRATELTDEMGLREIYGPGEYHLIARGGGEEGRRYIVAHAMHRLLPFGSNDAPDDQGEDFDDDQAPPPNAATPQQSGLEVMAMWQQQQALMMKQMDEVRREQINSMQQQSAITLEAVTKLASARIGDMGDMLKAALQGNTASQATSPIQQLRDAAKFVSDVRDDAIESMEAAHESLTEQNPGESELVQLVNSIAKGAETFQASTKAAEGGGEATPMNGGATVPTSGATVPG